MNRSITNLEFHHNYEHVNEIGRRIVRRLADHAVRALNPSAGFPMEMDKFPGRIWVVSHQTVAVAAGLGQMGLHRCVIHPKFGSFISLGIVWALLTFRIRVSGKLSLMKDFQKCFPT